MAEYIDRTALGIGYADPKVFINPAHADGWNTAIQIINEVPAADVAPVVRGKWLNIDGDYTFAACSICKEDYEVATEEEAEKGLWGAFLSAYRYCPNCGAKMDEEVNYDD